MGILKFAPLSLSQAQDILSQFLNIIRARRGPALHVVVLNARVPTRSMATQMEAFVHQFGRMSHRILLIDDEEQVLAATSEYLQAQGYEVDCAQEPEEAEALLEHLNYSLVVTDLGLSKFKGLQGLDIAQHIRQTLPKIRTIVMSGHYDPEVQNEAQGKIDAFLPKPVSLPELARVVAKLLENQA